MLREDLQSTLDMRDAADIICAQHLDADEQNVCNQKLIGADMTGGRKPIDKSMDCHIIVLQLEVLRRISVVARRGQK